MSRPPGLPARPPNGPYDQRGDSYRPPPPPANNYSSRDSYGRNGDAHRENDRYQFRGNGYSNGDESRPPGTTSPNYRHERSPPRFGGGDSYRPPSSDFSFRQEAPPSLDLSRTHDSYRPQLRPARQGPLRGNRRHDGRDAGRDGTRYSERKRGGGYQNRGGFSRKAAERPFLNTNRAPTPELMPGMDEADGHGTKYLAFEDLSDSEEAEMDLSSDDDGGSNTDEQPKKKQARTEIKSAADGDSVPRWSNPDPYTALPPPDESRGKKKDVVKLIRKARVTVTHGDSAMASAAADDFISFDFDEVEEEEEVEEDGTVSGSDGEDNVIGVPGAPTGPRNDANSYSHRDAIHGKPEPKPQPEPQPLETPKQKQFKMDITSNPDLGNRKRTHDDEIKGPSLVLKPAPKYAAKGHILREWKCPTGSDATPWCIVDHSATANMGFWLHKEIMDFYHHVKPSESEQVMREALISSLRQPIKRIWRDADIQPFGSFPAGLYLPTADMDLVLVSDDYMRGGYGRYNTKSNLYKLRNVLDKDRIAAPNTIEVIAKAKVPLVKYIDQYTGLKVDISFENDTGLTANKTFQDWKRKFLAMPILVTLIKQFLAMRGLNEPVNGGIGGFSVTCLVTSLLQLMPQIQSGTMIPEHHLGEVLMEFFDLYGNEFNFETTAIQTNPPAYIAKHHARDVVYRNYDRISIIDPNNESNDISGGASNSATIRAAFSAAYKDLQARMAELQALPIAQRQNQSILSVILGGDYSSFEIQRRHLERLIERRNDRR